MRLLAVIAVIALAATGCIGSSSAGSSQGRMVSPVVPPPQSDMMITYTVRTCPPGVRCVAASNGQHDYIVSRHLACSPAVGDYTDPAAACRALADLLTKRSPAGPIICDCLAVRGPKAVGRIDGKQQTIRLDGCSLCGVRGISADLSLLLPGSVYG